MIFKLIWYILTFNLRFQGKIFCLEVCVCVCVCVCVMFYDPIKDTGVIYQKKICKFLEATVKSGHTEVLFSPN